MINWIMEALSTISFLVVPVAILIAVILLVLGRVTPFWVAPVVMIVMGVFFLWISSGKDKQIHKLEMQISTIYQRSLERHSQDQEDARSASVVLADKATSTRKETNEKVQTASTQSADLLRRLRAAEARAIAAEQQASALATSLRQAAVRDDGAELPGQIGEEDVLEALRADTIRVHLLACYAQYDRAKAELEAFQQRPQATAVE